MKERTKKYLKLSLILYVVILCVAVVGTLAWYNLDRSPEQDPEDIGSIVSGKNVDICINDGNNLWGNEIEITRQDRVIDISMNPDGVFYCPLSLDENDKIINGSVCPEVEDPTNYYIKLSVKVRSNEALSLYLEDTSFVKGASIAEGTEKTDNPDAIAGAARVAFFEVGADGKKTLKTVWVPNEKYQLDGNGHVTLNGVQETEYNYLNVQEDGKVYTSSENLEWEEDLLSVGKRELASCKNSADENEIIYVNDATPLLTFDAAGEKQLEVCIWIEGTDREAKTLLSGGSISYGLNFVGVKEKEGPKIDVNKVTFDGSNFLYEGANVNDLILYSIDGNTFTTYMPENPNVDKIKFIRVAETAQTKLGESREFSLS